MRKLIILLITISISNISLSQDSIDNYRINIEDSIKKETIEKDCLVDGFSHKVSNNKVHKNFIIFIDARLFTGCNSGHLEFIDTMQENQIVKFQYCTGELIFENTEFDRINSCSKENDLIKMYLEYRDFIYKVPESTDRLYVISLGRNVFSAGSVVLTIANTDKKKGEYVYDIYFDHIVGMSTNRKAMKQSRKLFEDYWISKKHYKRDNNVFVRIWRAIRR